jgi:hypothetical protein
MMPTTIHVVAAANSPSSNREFLSLAIERPTAIAAVVSNNPLILNWNRRLGVSGLSIAASASVGKLPLPAFSILQSQWLSSIKFFVVATFDDW